MVKYILTLACSALFMVFMTHSFLKESVISLVIAGGFGVAFIVNLGQAVSEQ